MALSSSVAWRRFPTRIGTRHLPAAARIAIAIVIFFSTIGLILSGSPLTLLIGGLIFVMIVLLLWRSRDLPILLLPAMYQWFQVAIKPILTVFDGQSIERVLNIGFHLEFGLEAAAIFGFAGVACFSIGMCIGAGRPRFPLDHELRVEARRWDRRTVLHVSIGAILLGHVLNYFAGYTGSAYQLVLPLANVTLVGLFALSYWCFVNATGYRYLIAVFTFEVILGLTGYFADFRLPVFILILAVIAARPTFRLSSLIIMTIVGVLVLSLATFWSEIKNDYRQFVNGGTHEQMVAQPFEDRLTYIYNAAASFDSDQFAEGFEKLLARFSYIDFLGATLSYVPKYFPHQDGKLIESTVGNMLMPRILFPNKPPLPDDTEITRRYTGADLRSTGGTSISIGYLGELYIDFGYFWSLVAAGVIGVGVGLGYRIIRDYNRLPRLLTYGIATIPVLPVVGFETELIKYINGGVLGFVGALIIQRVIAPRALSIYSRLPTRRPMSANRS